MQFLLSKRGFALIILLTLLVMTLAFTVGVR